MTRKWFLGKPLFKGEKKNMKLIRKVHSIPAEGEGLLCISLTNFLLPGLLRSVPSNGTTFLIIFHKSQFKCSALLSRTGIAANAGLQHKALPRPASPAMERQPSQAKA